MKRLIATLRTGLSKLEFLPPLLTRLTVGWVFAESGWGKLHNIQGVTEYFVSLGIPMAQYQAPFVAGVELVGGSLLMIGLFTRVISLPLIATMAVAILTAKKEEISVASDLYGMSEFLMIVALVWLVVYGPGAISLDKLLARKFENL